MLWLWISCVVLLGAGRNVHGITHGEETPIREVSYQVELDLQGKLFCGGVLISHTYVLTAGHCAGVPFSRQLRVRLGSQRTNVDGTFVEIKQTHVHYKFSENGNRPGQVFLVDYDVALLELEESVEFTLKSRPIRVADHEPRAGDILRVSGYGRFTQTSAESPKLESVEIPVGDRATCQMKYSLFNAIITPRMFCAGAIGRDSCYGDSGGPAVLGNELVGLVSWGIGCGRLPGVYTNLADPEIRHFIRTIAKV